LPLGEYAGADPYSAWPVFRSFTERLGIDTPGGGEQLMQDFWETLSKRTAGGQMGALRQALADQGLNLDDAYQDFAIYEKCLLNWNQAGLPESSGRCSDTADLITSDGYFPTGYANGHYQAGSSDGYDVQATIPDDYALRWIRLSSPNSTYGVTLSNDSAGGRLRGAVECLQLRGLHGDGLVPAQGGGPHHAAD